ncbi:MAG: DUF4433 domain-containing protein [Saprospiraceae bacterium]
MNIGDGPLIEQRAEHLVPAPSGGTLGDYIPFYFGGLSPMLLNIKTGYRGVEKRLQSEIVYLCVKFDRIKSQKLEWCFTDGHAKDKISTFFKDEKDFDKVDWGVVPLQYWKNTEEDFDRMRRKQAEFLVKDHVPAELIEAIVVYDQDAQNHVQKIVSSFGLSTKVFIDQKNQFYYP